MNPIKVLIIGFEKAGEILAQALSADSRFKLLPFAFEGATHQADAGDSNLNLICIDEALEQMLGRIKQEEQGLIAVDCLGSFGELLCHLRLPFVSIHPQQPEAIKIQNAARLKVAGAIIPRAADNDQLANCVIDMLLLVDQKNSSANQCDIRCYIATLD